MADCKKCGKPIKWAKTEDGKFIPMEKGTDVKEYLMVVDYEENDRGWKTPVVKSMRLYEAHRNHCEATDDWVPPQDPPKTGGGFQFQDRKEPPKYETDDIPF